MVKTRHLARTSNKPKSIPSVTKWTRVSAKSKKKQQSADSLPTCVECADIIDADVKALQCEMCSTEVWKCAQCLGLSDEVYEFLASSSDNGLHWFCDKCEEVIVNGIGPYYGKMLEVMQNLDGKADEMMQKICEVSSNTEQKLCEIPPKVEQKIVERSDQVEQKICENVEQQITDITIKLETMFHDNVKCVETNVDTVQECVAKALDVKHQEDKGEEAEIARRATSVIVHGVSESNAASSDQRETEDMDVVAAMMHELDCDDVKVGKLVRLGRRPSTSADGGSDSDQKPRPIKPVLESEEQKVSVLRRAKNLRLAKEGGWEHVFIHQDLTPKQREVRKVLLREMKERTTKGEKDLMILNGKIVKRRPRPNSN